MELGKIIIILCFYTLIDCLFFLLFEPVDLVIGDLRDVLDVGWEPPAVVVVVPEVVPVSTPPSTVVALPDEPDPVTPVVVTTVSNLPNIHVRAL